MKEFTVKTPYECLIKNNGEEEVLSPNDTLSISGKVMVYPIGKNDDVIPFSFDTESLTHSSFYDFIEDAKLICFKDKVLCENYTISSINVGGSTCTFEIGEHKVVITCKNFKKVVNLMDTFQTFKVNNKDNIALLHLKGGTHTLYALNVKTGKIKSFVGKEITVDKEGFTVHNENFEEKYKITNEGLSLASPKVQTLSAAPSDETIAYHFLNALKKGDTDAAYNLCSPFLQENISKENLKAYFGRLENFFFLTPTSYAVKTNGELKIFSFQIQDNKILEIDD